MTVDLSQPWDALPVVVIDTETTGLSPDDGHAVVDIAAVRFEGGRAVGRFSTYVNPGRLIPPESTAIHGITDAAVKDAPALKDVAGDLARVCDGAIPCAYNSTFDRAFLHASITGTDCAAFDPSFPGWLCPLVVVREVDRFVAGKGRHKLEATCKRWGVEMDGPAHRALTDATAAGRLLFRLLERGAVRSCPADRMLAHTEKKRAEHERDFQAWFARQQKQGAEP